MIPKFSVCFTDLGGLAVDREFASEVEDRGFYGIFLPENSHLPLNRPGTVKSFANIERLGRFYDPFPCLAALSILTKKIKLGTSVCLLPQRDPDLLARSVWSLQRLAKNRFVMGVAGGFIREAMENHGAVFSNRWNMVENTVSFIRRYCEDDTNSVVKMPPIWIGSNSKKVPERVAGYGDGWMTRRSLYPGDAIKDMKLACDEIGRDFADISMVLMDAPFDVDLVVAEFEAGYSHFVYFVPGGADDLMFKKLEAVTRVSSYFQ